MTLDDLKSWWKYYSPIIKEAKKRNNLNLLNVYVNVCRDNINTCREDIHNEDELKALKIMERALEETLLDASMKRQQGLSRQEKEGQGGKEKNEAKETDEGERTFVERIRERYGKGKENSEGEGAEGIRGEMGAEGREEEDGGDNLLITLDKGVGGRRHEENSTYHFETNVDTMKNILPTDEIVLDNLDSIIYNIEQFIKSND